MTRAVVLAVVALLGICGVAPVSGGRRLQERPSDVMRFVERGPRCLAAFTALNSTTLPLEVRDRSEARDRTPSMYRWLDAGSARAREQRDQFDLDWHRAAVAFLMGPGTRYAGFDMPRSGYDQNAREFVLSAGRRHPRDGYIRYAIGFSYERAYRASASQTPGDVRKDYLTQAARAYEAVGDNSDFGAEASLRLAVVRRLQGRFAEALRLLQELIDGGQRERVVFLAYLFRGEVLTIQGDRPAAVVEYTRASAILPTAQSAMVPLAALIAVAPSTGGAGQAIGGLPDPPAQSGEDPYVTFFAPGYRDFDNWMNALRGCAMAGVR
jgi:tetratricopeptide (TPR) repeat protein